LSNACACKADECSNAHVQSDADEIIHYEIEGSFVRLTLNSTTKPDIYCDATYVEVAVLIAFFVVSPVAVGALFAFARFADRNFRDSMALEDERFPRGEHRNRLR
jgi:hypothetical protein